MAKETSAANPGKRRNVTVKILLSSMAAEVAFFDLSAKGVYVYIKDLAAGHIRAVCCNRGQTPSCIQRLAPLIMTDIKTFPCSAISPLLLASALMQSPLCSPHS